MNDQNTRRSIRKYANRPVEEALLKQLLEEAGHTQTMGNLQLYSVVVTKDNEMKKRLAPAHFCQPMVTQAPVLLTICADYHRTTAWCRLRKASPGYDNFLSFINAATDALLFTQTFCNLAEDAGLGLCFLGTTVYNPQPIIKELHLPKLVMPVATLSLGYPDEEPEVSDRLPLDAFIHDEVYHDYTAKAIEAFYCLKEGLEVNKAFIKENGKETLAQVYTDVRYTRKDNEAMSESFLETLKQQGFLS